MTTEALGGRRAGRIAIIAALAAVAAIGVGGERWASAGEGGSSVPLAAQTPSVIVPLEPVRILDTRTGVGAPVGRVAPGSTITLQVTGVGGVPAEATGVVLNLTATVADGAGYVTAYPAGGALPNASVINYSAGEDVANMVTAQLGAGGALAIFNDQANVHLVADVAGYLVPGTGGVGPQGPPGPQGPGMVEFEASVPWGGPLVTVLDIDGFSITSLCESNQTFLQFNGPGNNLRLGGVGFAGANAPIVYDNNGNSSTALTKAGPTGPLHFTGIIESIAVGKAWQLEIHMSPTNPCRVWGTRTPVG